MNRSYDISYDELKKIILLRSTNPRQEEEIRTLAARTMGQEPTPETPQVAAMNAEIKEMLAGVIAERLLEDDRTVELLSADDLAEFLPLMVEKIESQEGVELSEEQYAILEGLVKSLFNAIVTAMKTSITSLNTDLYSESWRLVDIVMNLAEERDLPLDVLFSDENIHDEITRRYHTRNEFIDNFLNGVEVITNPEILKDSIMKPILQALLAIEGENIAEMEDEVSAQLDPLVHDMATKYRAALGEWITNTADRIYGPGLLSAK